MIVLLACLQFNFTLYFSMFDSQESELVDRYFTLHGVRSMVYGGGAIEMRVHARGYEVKKLLESFDKEFGVEIPIYLNTRVKKHLGPTFVVEGAERGDSWSQFASDSLVKKAYDQLVRFEQVHAGEQLVRCRYQLRPWIDDHQRRTETIEGTFTLREGAHVHDVKFTYWP